MVSAWHTQTLSIYRQLLYFKRYQIAWNREKKRFSLENMNSDLGQCTINEKEKWTGPNKLRKNSEEEFLSDEKISSSDSEEQRRKNVGSDNSPSNQRKSKRNTKKRKWPGDYFENDHLDTDDDWKGKRNLLEESESDSDPVWSPIRDQVLDFLLLVNNGNF